jgi:hypothetical protein
MPHLPRGASNNEAQEASGLQFHEWIFFKVTCFQPCTRPNINNYQNTAKHQADQYVEKYPSTQWNKYAPRQQEEVSKAINERLAAENIQPVGEDIIAWKMHSVIRDVIKAKNKRSDLNHFVLLKMLAKNSHRTETSRRANSACRNHPAFRPYPRRVAHAQVHLIT